MIRAILCVCTVNTVESLFPTICLATHSYNAVIEIKHFEMFRLRALSNLCDFSFIYNKFYYFANIYSKNKTNTRRKKKYEKKRIKNSFK